MQEDVSSSYLQKTVSIAESVEEVPVDEQDAGSSAHDKVLAKTPTYSGNGASSSASSDDEDNQHLPSFETHRQHSDSEGRSKKPAFQSMDLKGDSE